MRSETELSQFLRIFPTYSLFELGSLTNVHIYKFYKFIDKIDKEVLQTNYKVWSI